MSISVADNFSYQGTKPLDARLKYDTLANMKAVADATMYDGCLAYCVATDKTYQWKSTNTVDADTGKWREFSSGGGGASALSELTDTNISTPTDGQVLKYDGTNDEWANGDIPKEVVEVYSVVVSTSTVKDVLSYLAETIGYSPTFPSVYDLYNSFTSLVAVVNSGQINAWYSDYKLSIKTIMGSTWPDLNAKYYDGEDHGVVRKSLFYTFESSWRSLASDNCNGSTYTSWWQITSGNTVYVAGDIDTTGMEIDFETIPTTTELVFYTDSSHTTEVTPQTGVLYVDVTTKTLYRWNGTAYEVIGGGTGASSVEDLTDTEIDTGTLTDGQILQYNGTDEKWENKDVPADVNAYHANDTAETALDDADYVPFYDSSATAKKKSLWSNIKSVLKSYFDTLYNGKPTVLNATLSAGSTSVTFNNVPTSGNYLITPYTSVVGLDYDSISQSGSTVTVTYSAQSSAVTVYLKIEGV